MEQPTLDEVRAELARIHDELLALPTDAFDRRAELKDRQNTLRQLSHQLLDGMTVQNADVLHAEFTRLQELRDRLLDERIAGSSIGDDAIWGELTLAINKAIDAGVGTDNIEARIKQILDELGRPST